MQSLLVQFVLNSIAILLAYLSPCKGVLHAVFALFLIDWATGVTWSIMSKRRFTSYRLRKSVTKAASYLITIVTAFILEESILEVDLHLINIVAGYIGFTELKSIYENLAKISGKDWILDIYETIKQKVKSE